ncbi:MAG: iron-containing alcohol dehydrogenase [Pseudothermotoga sp.]|nr:iron-containing alcohol dehydrogenase [Pseudothermotoga sp.]
MRCILASVIALQDDLKESFRCTCGKVHSVPRIEIVFEESAYRHIDDFFENATYLVDENTAKLVETPAARTIKLEGSPRVLATMENIEKAMSQLRSDLFVSVGSGSLTDIAKYAACLAGKNFSCFPTAPSVDGYTSCVAAILMNGEKTTVQAVVPKKVVVDMTILSEAPVDLLRAGIGDIAAKVTARLDWKLSNLLIGEPICEFAWDQLKDELEAVLGDSERVLSRDKGAVLKLMKGLLTSGLNISIVGNSRPASGAEHLISHTLEMYQEIRNEVPPFHGLSVAMGTCIALKAYKAIFEGVRLKRMCLTLEERYDVLSEFFGEGRAKRFMNVYGKKIVPGQIDLDSVKRSLKSMYEKYFRKIESALETIRVQELFASYEPEFIAKLILVSNTIRQRYTVLDLLDGLCLLKDFAHNVFEV